MLRLLRIANFAIVRELEVEFGAGLNVLTGETGAGKSLLLGALNLALGGRASSELIRTGEEEASVEALFDLPPGEAAGSILSEAGAEGGGGELLLRRRLSASGRNRVYANGALVPLSLLESLGRHLVSLHGQHGHQPLLQAEDHLRLLDAFGGLEELRERVEEGVRRLREVEAEDARLRAGERERAQREDLLRFQVGELEGARLVAGEEEALRAELNRLANAERLRELAGGAYAALYEEEGSLTERLGSILRQLAELRRLDPAGSPPLEEAEGARVQLEELARALRDYADSLDSDPARLAEVQARLDLLRTFKRKYGGSAEECLAHLARAREELDRLAGGEARIGELERAAEEVKGSLRELCPGLSERRREAARALEREMEGELSQLGMEKARFSVALDVREQEGSFLRVGGRPLALFSDGADQGQFLFSANPGEALRPLHRVASGGELSRLMLALQCSLRRGESTPTLVFDEVDAGIGGAVAEVVGRKLKALARDHQVLVVTHLPQVASLADRHFRVWKAARRGRTLAGIEPLGEAGRVEEVARMAAGLKVTETARRHAREMLGME